MSNIILEKLGGNFISDYEVIGGNYAAIRVDLRSVYESSLSIVIKNQNTAPNNPCSCIIAVAHTAGGPPAVSQDWGTSGWYIYTKLNSDVVNGGITTFPTVRIPSTIPHLMIMFVGNDTQPVNVSAALSYVGRIRVVEGD